MMWSWVDGHLILAMIFAPIAAYLTVGFINEWRRHRAHRQQEARRDAHRAITRQGRA